SNEQRKLPDNVIITSANLNGVHNEVLVVDDEPSIAKFLEELLTQKGYIVSAITDSKKALQLFRVNPKRFSLVITDQTMPKLTGLELVDLLRVENPRLPVILCSGYSQNIEPNELKKKSICFLQKPLDYETLLNSVEQQLTQTSQRPL
ncbi:MAG: response regulator, partial [Gammaproteobacteria bacterium]|nr:response regulator [Gammaproteobacteria bacterium]